MITINATGDTTLYTAGKYCEEDILIKVPEGEGEDPILQDKTIKPTRSMQTIEPDLGYDGLSSVTIEAVSLQDKTVAPEKMFSLMVIPDSEYDGLASVEVQPIPFEYIIPEGTLDITENGSHNVAEYANVTVSVSDEPPILQEKTVTENGEVTSDEGYDGLSKVIVNVAGSGGTTEDLNVVLTEQEEMISTLKETLKNKASEEINKGMCTVNIIPPSNSNYYVCRETVDGDGIISYAVSRSYTSNTISVTARCDSVMYIQASTIKSVEATDGEVLYLNSGHGIAYKTPSLNNSIVQVTLGG